MPGDVRHPGVPHPGDGVHVHLFRLDRLQHRQLKREQCMHRPADPHRLEPDLAHQREARVVQQIEGIGRRPFGFDLHRHAGHRRMNLVQHGRPARRSDPRDAAAAHREGEGFPVKPPRTADAPVTGGIGRR